MKNSRDQLDFLEVPYLLIVLLYDISSIISSVNVTYCRQGNRKVFFESSLIQPAAVNKFNQEWNLIILDMKYTSVLGLLVTLKSLCFNGLIAVTGHLYFICAQFCIIFVFAIYFWICNVRYIYSNVWFQCKTSECLVSFKFLSMSCMGSFQWPFHYKKLLLSNKNICWATYLCSCDLFVSFSRAVNYIFFTYLFFIAQ